MKSATFIFDRRLYELLQEEGCCCRCIFAPHAGNLLPLSRTPNSLLHFAFQTAGLGQHSVGTWVKNASAATTLKIDRSFIAQLDGSDSGLAIVHAIIWLGHAMSMRVTAEGVENAEQLTLLRDMGCDEVQGFHLNRPMPAEQLCSLLTRERTNTIQT